MTAKKRTILALMLTLAVLAMSSCRGIMRSALHLPGVKQAIEAQMPQEINDDTIHQAVYIRLLLDGESADLNDLDVSQVTSLKGLFSWPPTEEKKLELKKKLLNKIKEQNKILAAVADKIIVYPGDFNGKIDRWDVSKVTNMDAMFVNNKAFKQDLSIWRSKTSQVKTARGFGYKSPQLSPEKYPFGTAEQKSLMLPCPEQLPEALENAIDINNSL